MIWVKDLEIRRGSFHLRIKDWKLPGQRTFLFGPSGAGKSTIVEILCGFVPEARVKWGMDNLILSDLPIEKRGLGVVFQSGEIFPHLTAEKNIEFPMKVKGLSRVERSGRLQELKEKLKLMDCWNTRGDRLSGGERQRTALARALASQPCLLILDEPFSSLDDKIRLETQLLVKDVLDSQQIPTLIISHDERDIKALGGVRVDLEQIVDRTN